MRLYKVTLHGSARYAGTVADARSAKAAMLEKAGLGPRSAEADVKEIDVPTSKPALLEFLNKLEESRHAAS